MIEWNKIENKLPEIKKPVFLIKNEIDGIEKADIGCLLINDQQDEYGWFIDDNLKIVKLEARSFWIYLEECTKNVMSDISDDSLIQSIVLIYLEKLSLFEIKFRRLAFFMVKPGLFPIDYYISGLITRVLSLNYGFETLIKTNNYLAAAHLVRLQLDNFLRLYAAWLVEDPDKFAMEVWKGKAIKNIKDRNGQLMKDFYLKKQASFIHPWISNVYDETSGYIHFSNKHIKNSTKPSKEKELILETFIGKEDRDVLNTNRLEAILCMIEISNCISELIFGWIYTKRTKGIQF